MSGPKISIYSLTGRAKEIVMGQIRCEQQSLACYTRTQEMVRSLLPVIAGFEQQRGNLLLLMKRTGEGADEIERLQRFQNELQAETEEIRKELAARRPRASKKYRISEAAFAEKQTELKELKALRQRVEQLRDRLEEGSRREQESVLKASKTEGPKASGAPTAPKAKSVPGDDVQRIRESILKDLAGVSSFETEAETPRGGWEDEKEDVRRELSAFLGNGSLSDAVRNDVRQALLALERVQSPAFLRTFEAVTVKGLRQRVREEKEEQAQKAAAFADLTARYEALCAMAGEEAKGFSGPEAAADLIREEIQRLELLLVRQREQAYISECVDQVMADMGYDLIGSRQVRKRSGKRFRNELFTFGEGTAVNVTYSPEGQISMELGGLAREDRVPTAQETGVLTRDMERFCGEFAEFERRMLKKGVVVGDRISMAPPTAEYATIINVSDYTLDEAAQITVMNASEKRRRQSEKRTMRRDGEWS